MRVISANLLPNTWALTTWETKDGLIWRVIMIYDFFLLSHIYLKKMYLEIKWQKMHLQKHPICYDYLKMHCCWIDYGNRPSKATNLGQISWKTCDGRLWFQLREPNIVLYIQPNKFQQTQRKLKTPCNMH